MKTKQNQLRVKSYDLRIIKILIIGVLIMITSVKFSFAGNNDLPSADRVVVFGNMNEEEEGQ